MSPIPGKGSIQENGIAGGGVLSASQTSLNSSVEVTEVQEELVTINLRSGRELVSRFKDDMTVMSNHVVEGFFSIAASLIDELSICAVFRRRNHLHNRNDSATVLIFAIMLAVYLLAVAPWRRIDT